MDCVIDWENQEHVLKALLLLYYNQTSDEQVRRETHYENNVGFNAGDARFCSSVAQQILDGRPITKKQFSIIRIALRKYKNQVESMGFDKIELPATAMESLNKPDKPQDDGLLKIENNKLVFVPHVYPSSQIKSLGFNWNGTGWVGNASISNARAVIAKFPNLIMDREVSDWWDAEIAVPVKYPAIVEESLLFDYQKESCAFLIAHPKAILGLAPGLGKTACGIISAKAVKAKKILVVCPLTLTRNWKNEIKKWINVEAAIWHGDTSNWMKAKGGWAITNYETVVSQLETLEAIGFDTVIIDESIMIKNHAREKDDNGGWTLFKTQRVQAVYELTRKPERVWLLSGSPTSRFFDDLWTQLHVLDSKRFGSYWRFAERYCEIAVTKWAKTIVANKVGAAEEIKQDTADMFFARTQDQVLDLPDWIIENQEIEMNKAQERVYDQMETDFLATLPDNGQEVLAVNILSQMIRLIQFASNPSLLTEKISMTPKWLSLKEMFEYEQKPIIVWTTFVKTAKYVQEMLAAEKLRVASLTGETNEKLRQTIVDEFQHGELDALIAHPGVGKFGLTLTAGRTAIYLERSYNGDDYYQSLHRIRRIGTTLSPHVIHLLSVRSDGSGTIDHVIDKVLKFRRESSLAITAGMLKEAFDANKALRK